MLACQWMAEGWPYKIRALRTLGRQEREEGADTDRLMGHARPPPWIHPWTMACGCAWMAWMGGNASRSRLGCITFASRRQAFALP